MAKALVPQMQAVAATGLTRYVQATPVSQTPRILLKIDEAAEALAVHRSEIYKLMKSNRLRSVGEGRAKRILLADVEAYVATLIASSDSAA